MLMRPEGTRYNPKSLAQIGNGLLIEGKHGEHAFPVRQKLQRSVWRLMGERRPQGLKPCADVAELTSPELMKIAIREDGADDGGSMVCRHGPVGACEFEKVGKDSRARVRVSA